MLIYILLTLTCIISVEVIKKFNLILSINSIVVDALKIKTVMFSKNIGDNWKEIIFPAYAFRIMQHSLKIIAIFLLIIAVILIIDAVNAGFLNFFLSILGIIASIIVSTAYILTRKYVLK
jgi:hypothetical protein